MFASICASVYERQRGGGGGGGGVRSLVSPPNVYGENNSVSGRCVTLPSQLS